MHFNVASQRKMSGNIENDRSGSTGKMFPMDLAQQKITIVKSGANSDVKTAHLLTGQSKTTAPGQIITQTVPLSLMRPTAQIISQGIASQPQMIVSGPPLLQSAQLASQNSQLISQGSQIITQASQIINANSQIIGPSGQIISPSTQIISQGTQLVAPSNQPSQLVSQSSHINNQGSVQIGSQGSQILTQMSSMSSAAGSMLSMGSQLVNAGGTMVVSTGTAGGGTLKAIPPSVRVLAPLPHHQGNPRPAMSSNVSGPLSMSAAGLSVSKVVGSSVVTVGGPTSHVPRGPAAGASLAVPRASPRPTTPTPTIPVSTLSGWNTSVRSGMSGGGVRGTALVYAPRGPLARSGPVAQRVSTPGPATTPPANLTTTLSVGRTVRPSPAASPQRALLGTAAPAAPVVPPVPPRPPSAPPRALPLLQRNYQPAKVVGVATVGIRAVGSVTSLGAARSTTPVSTLYYEVSPARPLITTTSAPPRLLSPYNHPISGLGTNTTNEPCRLTPTLSVAPIVSNSVSSAAAARPSILRKRDIDGSPNKTQQAPVPVQPPLTSAHASPPRADSPWGDGGSTTVSAASSPGPDDAPSPPAPATPPTPVLHEVSPRKKPRKQMLVNEVRECEFQPEEVPPPAPSPPAPAPVPPPPRRSLLGSSWRCGWRATALHFARPADVRRREPRPPDVVELANQRHALLKADGWKVHHLAAQMDDLTELEAGVFEQLETVLRNLEKPKNSHAPKPPANLHGLIELVKGNMQRSRIVCDGVSEAREDIMRLFSHRKFVLDILTRQTDKRCFRKHSQRTQS